MPINNGNGRLGLGSRGAEVKALTTTLRSLALGTKLNVEVDLLARYVVRYLSATGASEGAPRRDGLEETLKRAGFVR